jgi:hypothetical protein
MKKEDIKKAKATFDDREFAGIRPVKLTPEQKELSAKITQELIAEFEKKTSRT